MRAALFHGVGQPLTIERIADPEPESNEVIIAIDRSGVCGTDLHLTSVPGHLVPGTVLGHEFAGTIAALGSDVAGGPRVGDRVTAMPIFPCGHCDACQESLPSLCPQVYWTGTGKVQGGYAELVAVRAALVQPVPAGVGHDEAGMIEPLAVAHHAVAQARVAPGEDVLVLGGGPIGAATIVFARAAGARHVIVSEPAAARRDQCAALGATGTIDPLSEDVCAGFAALTGGAPHVLFECAGRPGLLNDAVRMARHRGRVVVCTAAVNKAGMPALPAFTKEISVLHSFGYEERDFARVIDALAQGRIAVAPMHTATVSLSQLPALFDGLREDPTHCKVLIDPALV